MSSPKNLIITTNMLTVSLILSVLIYKSLGNFSDQRRAKMNLQEREEDVKFYAFFCGDRTDEYIVEKNHDDKEQVPNVIIDVNSILEALG